MEKTLERVLRTACFLLMLAMVTIIFAQVIARYVLSDSLSWSEEVGRYLFIWMTFLGAALALRNGNHVALDVLVARLPAPLKKACLVFGNLAMAIFAVVIVYGGYAFVLRGSRQMSAAL
jgi:TRAP-type C4-dicarboxylate transport system permease small subunit